MKKRIAISTLLLITFLSFAQELTPPIFGKITRQEAELKFHEKDSTANALVLYESGSSKFFVTDRNIVIRTTFYKKIKIFNKEGYKHATFSIPIYQSGSNSEAVKDIRAITHNVLHKTYLDKDQIFKEKINEHWKEVKFTMPNLKEGAIVEVEYTLETPYKFNLTGWKFQSSIPKLYSEYNALIPGNYIYNRELKGFLRLAINEADIKTSCFKVRGYLGESSCEKLVYAMEDIPAFIEEEHMTNSDNFISQIKFELAKTIWFDGTRNHYTSTWEAVDREIKTDKEIGKQLKKISLFEDNLPPNIIEITDNLKKAKEVYRFIQNYYSWNSKYGLFKNVNIKKAFESKIGNISEINISLHNTFKAVGLDAKLVLISTRNNGLPTKLHPVMSDFNYSIVKLDINGKSYLLDATDKLVPFGVLPYRCLNSYGRVMDFENGSYWLDIEPISDSKKQLTANLILNEDGTITGELIRTYYGYYAINFRKKIASKSEDDIISGFEDSFNNLEVLDYSIHNQDIIDKQVVEVFKIKLDYSDNLDLLYLNPYFSNKLSKNPFKQNERLYPVDFGYPRKDVVTITLELPDNYSVESVPEAQNYVLKDKKAQYSLIIRKYGDYKVSLKSSLNINKPIFYSFEYEDIKALFKNTINIQKEYLSFKKGEKI